MNRSFWADLLQLSVTLPDVAHVCALQTFGIEGKDTWCHRQCWLVTNVCGLEEAAWQIRCLVQGAGAPAPIPTKI